jgi:tyrosine-specific transport protein
MKSSPNYEMDDSILVLRLQIQRGDEGSARQLVKNLSAVSTGDKWNEDEMESTLNSNFPEAWLPVLSTSLMITGNTVGAGMLVLPEISAGPGMGISSIIFGGAFLVNLVSGLIIAEVGINQHANSGDDVPSSFKDFAEVNLNSHTAATVISFISFFVNALVMAFNTVKVGDIGSVMVDGVMPSEAISVAWVLGCAALVGTQTFTSLSAVISVLVTGLFISFAGLLLPGLAQMTVDPFTILSAPGTSMDVMASAGELIPVIIMSLVYQNIVPTVTKILDYDRTKTTVAICLGSLIPLMMYMAWDFAVIGGGVDTSVGLDGPLMTIFYLTTVAGSSIGCIMSASEEIESFLKPEINDSAEVAATDKFSFPAVLASVICSIVTAQFFADDLNSALKVAGAFGTPLLYGVLPVVMAFTQRQQCKSQSTQPQIPAAAMATLGVASTGYVGNEILHSVGDALGMSML